MGKNINYEEEWEVSFYDEFGQYFVFDGHENPIIDITKHLNKQKYKGNTAKANAVALKDFFVFLEHKGLDFKNIENEHIIQYHTWANTPKDQRGSGLVYLHADAEIANSTWNKKLSAIKSFYTRYVVPIYTVPPEDKLDFGTLEITHINGHTSSSRGTFSSSEDKTPVKQKYIPEEHLVDIINATSARNKLILLLFMETGLRSGELLSLHRESFLTVPRKTDTGLYEFKLKNSNSKDKRRQTKTGYRDISCTLELAQRISKYILLNRSENKRNTEYVFTTDQNCGHSKSGDPLSYDSTWSIFKKACRSLGLEYTLHDMRHTFVTNMLISGAGIVETQAAVGHKNINTTKQYDRRSDKDLLEKIAPIKLELYGGMYEQID